MKICVTGGMGFIGSHTVIELLKNGDEPIVVDNLCNSSKEVLNRIKTITGKDVKFYELDLRDESKLEECFKTENFESVIHFAGLKAVGESVKFPELYIDNNIGSTNVLLKVMAKYGVKNLIFSSSATVYGVPKNVPLVETDPVQTATNPYGQTKIDIEKILINLAAKDNSYNLVLLRYFNPVGAHESGLMGEDPAGIPNNLMPYISQVAVGKLKQVHVYGDDYKTHDGTGVRDYIHVVDLAIGHVKALSAIKRNCGLTIYNLGTGKGTSVLDLIHAFEKANDIKIPYVIDPRRPGDVDENYANADKAKNELGWVAVRDVVDMCRDSFNWQSKNPNGYNK